MVFLSGLCTDKMFHSVRTLSDTVNFCLDNVRTLGRFEKNYPEYVREYKKVLKNARTYPGLLIGGELMSKVRPGQRVEFRLPEDHPFFTVVPLGKRQEWLTEKITAALALEAVREKEKPNSDEVIQRIENKLDQILSVMADGITVKNGADLSKQEQSQPETGKIVAEKPKPAVKNLRALMDF